MLNVMETDPEWQMFSADNMVQDLKDAKAKLETTLGNSTFITDYILADAKQMKNHAEVATLDQEYGAMVKVLDPAIKELSRQTSAVVAMKMARQNALKPPADSPVPAKKARRGKQ